MRSLDPRVLVILCALAIPTAVMAAPQTPDLIHSTAPDAVSLVGSYGSVPARAFGQFQVVVRDDANNPVAGAVVTLDLSECLDLTLCADQLDPDATVDCVHRTISKTAGADGSVLFTVLGGSNGTGNATTILNKGEIFANGVYLRLPIVSAYDLDGFSGVGANDMSVWIRDFGLGQDFARSDYDGNGHVGANDFSMWLVAFGSTTMGQSCATACP